MVAPSSGVHGCGAADETERDGAGDGGRGPCWVGMTRRQKKDGKRRGGREVRRPAPLGVDAPSQRDGWRGGGGTESIWAASSGRSIDCRDSRDIRLDDELSRRGSGDDDGMSSEGG